MGIRIARGTYSWVVTPLVVAAIFGFLVGPSPLGGAWHLLWILPLVVASFLLNFFRDPERVIGEAVVSPADGRVLAIDETEEGPRLAIFMSPLDVHVNRAPAGGRVTRVVHHPGAFKPAFDKESEANERVEIELATDRGMFRVVQIAGLVARRIVPYVREGQAVEKGERIGIIRLGSRVDLTLPPDHEITVSLGQTVKAGETTVGRRQERPP
ncbi:MAG: phosphatidylserine decarboxylase [Methanobacteriota archaeon]